METLGPGAAHRTRWFLAIVGLLMVLPSGDALGNPVPDGEARAMNERPARWFLHPTAEDERMLVAQFASYGIAPSLLSPATMTLLERNFHHFAPLLVRAQQPPNPTQQNLQRWFRERATPVEAEAMKAALRQWLTAPVPEAPIYGGMRTTGPPEFVKAQILGARVAAAEALGDWHDVRALSGLRALQAANPGSPPALATAILRITDPNRPELIAFGKDRQISPGRNWWHLDSLVIESHDAITQRITTWRADRVGMIRIWAALDDAREARPGESRPSQPSSFEPRRLAMFFPEGLSATLERSWAGWRYEEKGRPSFRAEIISPALDSTVLHELRRVGIAPSNPRFVSETVTLTIEPEEMEVEGIYSFEGATADGWVVLRYPIAQGPDLGPPRIDYVDYVASSDGHPMPTHVETVGTELRIGMSPGGASRYTLQVRYRQPLRGRSATYLITSGRAWGQPLHNACFQVITRASLGDPRFSLPLLEVDHGQGQRRFILEIAPFSPDHDLVVRW